MVAQINCQLFTKTEYQTFFVLNLSAERDSKVNVVRAIVETGLVVVGIAVSGGAIPVNKIDILSIDNRSSSALLRGDGRSRAAVVKTRVVGLRVAKTKGRREVPPLARRKALDDASVLNDTEITYVVFAGRAPIQTDSASGGHARTLLNAGNDFGRAGVTVYEGDIVPNVITVVKGREEKFDLGFCRGVTAVRSARRKRLTYFAVLATTIAASFGPETTAPAGVRDAV